MKLVIASLLVFSLVILFLFALFPSDITVTRIVQIDRAPGEVLKQIDDLRNWEKWNEFVSGSFENGITNMKQYVGADSAKIDMGSVHIQLIKVAYGYRIHHLESW